MFEVFDNTEVVEHLRLFTDQSGGAILAIPEMPAGNLLHFTPSRTVMLYAAINQHVGLRLDDDGRLLPDNNNVLSRATGGFPTPQGTVTLRLVDHQLNRCVFVAAVDRDGQRVEGGWLASLRYDGRLHFESGISTGLGIPLDSRGRMFIINEL